MFRQNIAIALVIWLVPFCCSGSQRTAAAQKPGRLSPPLSAANAGAGKSVVMVPTGDAGAGSEPWTPNPNVATSLDKPATLGALTIRPPMKTVLSVKTQQTSKTSLYSWDSTGTVPAPHITVMFGNLRSDEAGATPDQALAGFIYGISDRRVRFKQTPPDHGKLAGYDFARTYFSGEKLINDHHVKTHGFAYAGINGNSFVILSSEDPDPDSATTLKVAEASALTLELASQSNSVAK